MSRVTICQYFVVDEYRRQLKKAERWGTREAIERLRKLG